jgi:ElaB/YqjD/DUF883 family membrane-anchored ribosome-binding protein
MASVDNAAGRTGTRTLAEQSGRVMSEVQELGRTALETASEAAAHLRDSGREAFAHGKERVVEAKGNFEHVVSANPLKSVLIAAGVGIALGLVLSRRSH